MLDPPAHPLSRIPEARIQIPDTRSAHPPGICPQITQIDADNSQSLGIGAKDTRKAVAAGSEGPTYIFLETSGINRKRVGGSFRARATTRHRFGKELPISR